MTNDTNNGDMAISCLGAFGGPVDPNLAMGGFNSTSNQLSIFILVKES